MKAPLLLMAQIGFIVLTIVFFAILIKEIKNGIDRTGWSAAFKRKVVTLVITSMTVWTLLVSVWSLTGIMSDFSKFPFNFMPVIAIPLITAIALLFSKSLTEILRNIPAANLIRLQSFRFFVELLLWALFLENIVPVQMTFEGRNFDILVGITAPLIAWLSRHNRISKTGLIIWNIACLILLINIVTTAILSTPSPLRVFMNEPSSTIVAYFPVSLLPGLLVPLAYILHLFSLKQILSKAAEPSSILKEA